MASNPLRVRYGTEMAVVNQCQDFQTFQAAILSKFDLQSTEACKFSYSNNDVLYTLGSESDYQQLLAVSTFHGPPVIQVDLVSKPMAVNGLVNSLAKMKEECNEEFECLSCDGTKLNKKGNTCKKCNGSGKLNPNWQRKLERMIESKISMMFSQAIEKQDSQLLRSIGAEAADRTSSVLLESQVEDFPQRHPLNNEAEANSLATTSQIIKEESKVVIERSQEKNEVYAKAEEQLLDKSEGTSICRGCELSLANLTHMKCPSCVDYIVCNECAEDLLHDHPLIAVNPCPIMREKVLVEIDSIEGENWTEVKQEVECETSLLQSNLLEIANVKSSGNSFSVQRHEESLSSIQIRCTLEDERGEDDSTEKQPNEVFTKMWKLTNEGANQWPEMKLVPIGENILKAECKEIPLTASGAECHVAVRLVAPKTPGAYKQFFGIQAGDDFIGDKLCIETKVREANQEDKKEKARHKLEELKKSEEIPEEYASNLLFLFEKSEEDPKWILSLLRENNNALDLIKELVLS